MKRVCYVVLLILLPVVNCQAQGKLFKKAMSQPRNTGCWYSFATRPNQIIPMDKLTTYAFKNDIILGKCTTKQIAQFGTPVIAANTVEFIPENEWQDYLFEKILDNTPVSQLSKTGAVLVKKEPDDGQHFKWISDVRWSGDVVNGKIDGQGKGIKQIDANNFFAFQGSFKQGIPQGTVTFFSYKTDEKEYYNRKKRNAWSAKMGTMNDGMTRFEYNISYSHYGFVNENGIVVVDPIYDKVTDYSAGVATVTINMVQFDIDKQGTVIGLHSGQNVEWDRLISIKSQHPEVLAAAQSVAKQMIPKSNIDNLKKIAAEFTALRSDVEAEVKKNIPSYNFDELAKVDNAFSNLKDFTLKRRTAIYNADCAKLALAYDKAVASSKQHQENMDDRDFVNEFVSKYEDTYKFDPDHKVDVAKQIQYYYELCYAVTYEGTPINLLVCLTCDPPEYSSSDIGGLKIQIAAWHKTANPPADFKEYANYARPIIERNGDWLLNRTRIALEDYKKAIEKAKKEAYRKLDNIKTYSEVEPYILRTTNGFYHEDKDLLTGEIKSTHKEIIYCFEGFEFKVYNICNIYSSKTECYYTLGGDLWNPSESYKECVVKGYIAGQKKYLDKKFQTKHYSIPTLPW